MPIKVSRTISNGMKMIVDGIATEYEDVGEGPVILMLHGWGDSLHGFDPLIPYLDDFRILRIDLPGFGKSELPPAAWNVDSYADFVANFLKKLNVNPALIVGHSLGGRITIKGVSRGIFAPKKIVLIASAGVAERATIRNATLKALAKVGKLAMLPLPKSTRERLRRRLYTSIKSDYANTGPLRDTFLRVISEDLSDAAEGVTLPTLLIWGSADETTPLSEGVRLSELIRGSDLKLIQAAGHFVHREHPQEVSDMIRAFL